MARSSQARLFSVKSRWFFAIASAFRAKTTQLQEADMRCGPFSERKIWMMIGLFFGVVLIFTSHSYGGKVQSFSADQVFLDARGTIRNTARLYVAPDKFRMEGLAMGPHGNMVMIVRKDLETTWTLNPEKETYFERPLDEEDMRGSLQDTFKKGKEEDLGTEKVSGYTCRKTRVTVTTDFMGVKRETKSIYWVSKSFDMPLRTQSEEGAITELRNIKKGKQPKGLFELSKGYRKVAGMLELVGPPSEDTAQEAAPKTKDEPTGFQIPEEVRKKLPKGFKLPFGK
jgi:outer membrane lipoprotein-sorting protein